MNNQLIAIVLTTAAGVVTKTVEYDYDAFGRRIGKRVDDNDDGVFDRAERFVYDSAKGSLSDIVLVYDDSGSLTNRYLHGPGVDQVFADENAANEILWALTDNQSTVRDVVDFDATTNTTTVVKHRKYDSFGNVTSDSDPSVDFLYSYTGREWDADAELYYYRARWYDPTVGVFTSEDPIGFAAGDTNLQRYVGNGATNFVDPSGLTPPTNVWWNDGDWYDIFNPAAIGAQYGWEIGEWEGAVSNFGSKIDGVGRRRASITENFVDNFGKSGRPYDIRGLRQPDIEGLKATGELLQETGEGTAAVAGLAIEVGGTVLGGVSAVKNAGRTVKGCIDGVKAYKRARRLKKLKKLRKVAQSSSKASSKAAKTGKKVNKGKAVKEGIYEFPDKKAVGKQYVGQSGDISKRLKKHKNAGRLQEGTEIRKPVSGGKTAREIEEHRRIQEITRGQKAKNSPNVSNQRDPIGPARRKDFGLPEPRE